MKIRRSYILKQAMSKEKYLSKEIPKHPMISLFITSDSNEHWLLHEEGSVFGAPVIAKF